MARADRQGLLGLPVRLFKRGRRLDNVAREASRHVSWALAAAVEETLGDDLSHLRRGAGHRSVLWVDRWPGQTIRYLVMAPKIHPAGAAEHLVKAQQATCPCADESRPDEVLWTGGDQERQTRRAVAGGVRFPARGGRTERFSGRIGSGRLREGILCDAGS